MMSFYRNLAYSKETHFILNYWTLQIHDKEIRQEYTHYRVSRFNKIFWPFTICMLLFNVANWLAYFYGDGMLSSAQRVLYSLVLVFVMAVFRYTCNKYSP